MKDKDFIRRINLLSTPSPEAKAILSDIFTDPAHIRKAAEEGAADQNAMLTPKTSCCQWCDPESDTQQRGCKKCPCHNKLADTDI